MLTLGLDVCLEMPPDVLHGARLGLLCNQASVDRRFEYSFHLLHRRFPGQLAAVFSPQHGLWGEQQDNMIETPHGRLAALDLPLHSLYAETRKPSAAMLDGLDCLVIDLQDVGTRVYTYIWTTLLCLQACAEHDVAVVVLDRPNPLGGLTVEGPVVTPELFSFVGLRSVPMRHGLTMGEMARWLNRDIGADLHVVPLSGWHRSTDPATTGRVWVAPSPNMPNLATVRVYPGQVLLEGTNLSEGRGTTAPFEQCGAPFIDPDELVRRLARHPLPGVVARPIRFVPTSGKWADQSCGGVFLHVTEPHSFQPYRTSLTLISEVHDAWPQAFAWRGPPYEYDEVHAPIDLLTGSPAFREAVERGIGTGDLQEMAAADAAGWWAEVDSALLYGPRPMR